MIAKAEESKTDVDAAIDRDELVTFLNLRKNEGPLCPCYIPFPKGSNTCQPFTDVEEAADWVARYAEKNSVYISNNPPKEGWTPRNVSPRRGGGDPPNTDDIVHRRRFQLDFDPVEGASLEDAKSEALKLLDEFCAEAQRKVDAMEADDRPPGRPAVTTIIDSGRGIHAHFDIKTAMSGPAATGVNELMIEWFRAKVKKNKVDGVANPARIMRLPGTRNHKTGTIARVLQHDPEALGTLALWQEFLGATEETPKEAEEAVAKVDTSTVRRLESLDELDEWNVPARVKVIIKEERHPNEPPKKPDDSRSAWLLDAVCSMVRCGVPDDVMLGVLLDRQFKISESVRDKRNPEKYARRQVQRAKDRTADFDKTKDGKILNTQRNVRLAIAKLGVTLEHDEFADRSRVNGLEGFGPHLDDKALNRLWLLVESRFGLSVGKEKFYAIVADEALENRRHPVREYLDSVQKGWDQEPRLDRLLIDYCGAEDTPYVRAVGSKALIAAVRRVRQPGCKFDEMLILEGPQGNEKSTVLLVLAVREEWHTDDLPLHADTKRQMETLAGRWIIEAGELKGMRRGEVEALKSFLSRQVDRARLAYGRATTELPRQSIIIGTTNASQYLRDVTGNRRFWPVRTGKINLEALRRDRDQLWAEAADREAEGESIRLDPKHWAAAAEEQESREQPNPFVEPLSEALDDLVGKIASADVWKLLGLEEPGRRTQQHNNDLGDAMRRLGWERTKRRIGGKVRRCYVRGDDGETERELVVRGSGDGWQVVTADEKEPF